MPSYGKSGNETICLAMVNLGMRLYVCHSIWWVKSHCGSCD